MLQLRSDAQQRLGSGSLNIINVDSVTVEAITLIQKELNPQDVISMAFLLYDDPEIALKRLTIYERIMRISCNEERDFNLLNDWYQKVHSRSKMWRQHEFLEALAVCQQFKIIRKLGFQVSVIKKLFQPQNIHFSFYLNPMKKALYKLCENMTSDNLFRLQNTLKNNGYDTTEHKYCEIVILELICMKFITVKSLNNDGTQYFEVNNLTMMIDNFPKLKAYADDLRVIERKCYQNQPSISSHVTSATPSWKSVVEINEGNDNMKTSTSAFSKYLNLINGNDDKLKWDNSFDEEAYAIKNAKRPGVCYIINQEEFQQLPKEGIDKNAALDKRRGTDKDKKALVETMTALNFEVICHRNLTSKNMMKFIKETIRYRVHHDDSMFMLCILSHGVERHVYAADSVKVNVEELISLIDEGFQERQLYDIPKVMILQACQSSNDEPKLVTDSPLNFSIPKSHFLVFWATAPKLEAFREETQGSIFIQLLCDMVRQYSRQESLPDIFTKVTNGVSKICKELRCRQWPKQESTLSKKLYLQAPELKNHLKNC